MNGFAKFHINEKLLEFNNYLKGKTSTYDMNAIPNLKIGEQ